MNILNSPDVQSTERNDRSASFFPPTGVSLWSLLVEFHGGVKRARFSSVVRPPCWRATIWSIETTAAIF
jgi:hypothetical protein